jgi:steroid delta-isomerase-like uncharacterized protein
MTRIDDTAGTPHVRCRRGGTLSRRAVGAAATGAALLAAVGRVGAAALAQEPAATPAGDCPPTTTDENKALVERYWAEVWTAGGAAAVPDLLAEDEIHHWGVGGDTVGHAPFIERLELFLAAFPDIDFEVTMLVAEDDLVVSRWTATATQQGEWLGIPASNVAVEWTGMNVFRVACGRIAEAWGEADHLGLLRQLGGGPAVATPAA